MKYIKQIDKSLIKKNNLISLLKTRGIKRISPEALKEIENLLKNNLIKVALSAKEQMIINGRRTVLKEDIRAASETYSKEENLEI